MVTLVQWLRDAWRELRERHVIRVGAFYLVVAWGVIEVGDTVLAHLGVPEWTMVFVITLVALGFPLALVLAWAYDVTPGGIRRAPPDVADAGAADAAGVMGAAGGAGVADTEAAPQAVPRPPAEPDDFAIVVLPFANRSPDAEYEYFSDGLTDELIADLSRIRSLRVISRTSAMRLKGAEKDLPTISRELGVRYVVEGSVRKSGESLRITAQLLDAGADRSLWAEKYSGTTGDVFDIQERVSRSICDALEVRLTGDEARALADRPMADPAAYESYLKARHEMWRFSEKALDRARRHVEHAMALGGENELCCATLGHIYVQYVNEAVRTGEAWLERTEECAERCFALNPESGHGWALRGAVHFRRGEFEEAARAFQRAREDRPDDPQTLLMLGYLYALKGREEKAAPLFERLIAVDPLTPMNRGMPGFLAWLRGRWTEAIPHYATFREMDPDNPFAVFCHAWILSQAGRRQEAAAMLEALEENVSHPVFAAWSAALRHALRGEGEAAVEAVSPALEGAAEGDEMFSRGLAEVYALAGEPELALRWLERAVELGFANYPFLAEHAPLLEPLRGEPAFDTLLERVRRDWEAFDA